MLNVALVACSRCLLVLLFLPFSALDKILNATDAQAQARSALPNQTLARLALFVGFLIEVTMSLGVVSGVADHAAALILALYCIATAFGWKQFWKSSDFRLRGASRGRDIFWDFLKNLALAGGFLTLTFGGNVLGASEFWHHPLESSHPYETAAPAALKPRLPDAT